MKLLIVGNGFTPLLASLIDTIAEEFEFIDLLDTHGGEIAESHVRHVYRVPQSKTRIPGLQSVFDVLNFRQALRDLPVTYDIIHLHYIRYTYRFSRRQLKSVGKRLVLTFWGTDLIGTSKFKAWLRKPLIDTADSISIANPEYMERVFSVSDPNRAKIHHVRFGLRQLERQEKLTDPDINRIYSEMQLSRDKRLIMIGTNGKPQQQHRAIIESIVRSQLPTDELQFIVPMSYGAVREYRMDIERMMTEHDWDVRFIDTFLSDRDIAALAKITDVLIHVQVADQLSGAMQEHLFARSIVITGSWLPYSILHESGAYLETVDKVSETGDRLQTILSDFDHVFQRTAVNPMVIESLSGWASVKADWLNLYK